MEKSLLAHTAARLQAHLGEDQRSSLAYGGTPLCFAFLRDNTLRGKARRFVSEEGLHSQEGC